MKTTYIITEDGRTEVQWWEVEDFKGRATEIYSMDDGLKPSELLQSIPIPDDVVLCDFCNEGIEEFPVPVVGNYALCKECFERIKKEGGR